MFLAEENNGAATFRQLDMKMDADILDMLFSEFLESKT
jgi:hypothetical protein